MRTIASWLAEWEAALASGDAVAAANVFEERCFWRDLIAFTGDLQTIEGRDAIAAMLQARLPLVGSTHWQLDPATSPDGSDGFILFETATMRGRGHVRLGEVGCATLLTAGDELKGYEEPRGTRRPIGVSGKAAGNWRDQREAERRELGVTRQPEVVIVGGGQGGLALAARLRQLAVPTIVVDRFARSGDQWRSRYKSLSLHDPVWYDHMPYLPFPDTWPVFTPKDKLADWLESYETLMELDVWHDTECVGARYDETSGRWDVALRRAGVEASLHPAHLVLAIGNAGKAITPTFPGQETFRGHQCHSSQHPGGEEWSGRQVVVIGSNNSAHDICADLAEHGAAVTMVQRSSTHIIRQETMIAGLARLYSEEAVARGLTVERADLLNASLPLRLLPEVQQPATAALKKHDAAFYEGLADAGFLLDFGEDDTGVAGKYLRSASGYYIDVGASARIIDGTIGLRSGVTVERIEPHGVLLSTGELLAADCIIYATGFGTMDQHVAELISPEVADRIGKVWGYGSGTRGDPGPWEGELRNMWKPTAQPGLWFHGGNLANSRFYSTFLAVQLKAHIEGIALPKYQSTGTLE